MKNKQPQKKLNNNMLSQKTNEDFNKKPPTADDPQLKPPLPKQDTPIKKAMKGMAKQPPKTSTT